MVQVGLNRSIVDWLWDPDGRDDPDILLPMDSAAWKED